MPEEEVEEVEEQDHLLSNSAYDTLKNIAQIYLPAAGTLYFTVAQIWHLPGAEEVVGTIVAVDTFLGVILGFSTKTYNNSDGKFDGQIHVQRNPVTGQKIASMELKGDVSDKLENQQPIVFKVNPVEDLELNNQDDMEGGDDVR